MSTLFAKKNTFFSFLVLFVLFRERWYNRNIKKRSSREYAY
nr:MAG TPA: hypothetical protein [Caudoviricetes sp.]